MGQRNTGALGGTAEQRALRFLLREGLQPVARNFRSRGGEVDLIMLHGNCLTFVEVRYRSSANYVCPGPTVDRRKQGKLVRTAALFLASRQRYAQYAVRFDVVAITGKKNQSIEWIRDAFRPTDSTL